MYYNNRIQVALFFNKLDERADKLFYKLNEALGEIFDNAPINIPVPEGAPVELPLLQATSSNRLYNLRIAKTRIDLTLNNTSVDDLANQRADKFYNIVMKHVDYLATNQQVIRFGLVSATIRMNGNPIDVIKSKYFNKSVKNPLELGIRYNNRRRRDTLLLNDIVEISTANVSIGNKPKEVVIVNRDINNVVDSGNIIKKQLLKDSIESFYAELLPERVKELL